MRKKVRPNGGTNGHLLDDFDELFVRSFHHIHSLSKKILHSALSRNDVYIRKLINLALANQAPTEYPFVFKYSYSGLKSRNIRVEKLAAAVHLLQTSTFVIDDVFDEAAFRNHKKTILKKAGVNYALVAGELLQTIALEVISIEIDRGTFANKGAALATFNRILKDVYVGQYLDLYASSDRRITTRDYNRIIGLTTGYFFSNLARCGALLANRSNEDIRALAIHGYHYGMALQITDDIIDIIDRPSMTGKGFANDLKCRRMRLPYIMGLRLADKSDRTLLANFLRRSHFSADEIAHVARLIRKTGAIDAATRIAWRHIVKSIKSISGLQDRQTKAALTWLSESLLDYQGLISFGRLSGPGTGS